MTVKPSEHYSGRVHTVVYDDPANAFYILKMTLDTKDTGDSPTVFGFSDGDKSSVGTATVKGTVPGLVVNVGTWFGFEASVVEHKKYGRQLSIVRAPVVLNGWTAESASRTLVANGIGERVMRSVRDHFGDEGLVSALGSVEKLEAVPGLGTFGAEHVRTRWLSVRACFETLEFLNDLGISSGLVKSVWDTFGENSEAVLVEDPWALVKVDGISFAQADEIGRRLGASDPVRRVRGAVLHVCKTYRSFGHMYFRTGSVLQAVQGEVSDVAAGDVASALAGLHKEGLVVVDKKTRPGTTAVYEPSSYRTERDSAEMLLSRMVTADSGTDLERRALHAKALGSAGPSTMKLVEESQDAPDILTRIAVSAVTEWGSQAQLRLSEDQKTGIVNALSAPVSVLSGLPGTGKTTSLRSAVHILEGAGIPFLLVAPTGIAAKNLTERTGAMASTVHRAFAAKGSVGNKRDATYAGIVGNDRGTLDTDDDWEWGFGKGTWHPAEVVIIDESSMLDQHLLFRVLDCTSPQCRLVFVGDHAQLPSVGPGNVLRGLIESKLFPTVKLTQIFRQKDTSGIVFAAHAIHAGNVPELNEDFRLFATSDEDEAADLVIRTAQKLYEGRKNFQVLSPRHAGVVGVTALNSRLRDSLNPKSTGKQEMRVGADTIREGDRIMVVRNDYKLKVYNGDVGKVVKIDRAAKKVEIKIFGTMSLHLDVSFKVVPKLLRLAYACTIHKCVHPDTWVETDKGTQRIADIADSGTIATGRGMLPYRSKVENREAPALHVKTRHGYDIVTTPEHGLDVWNGLEYARKDVSAIVPDDWVRLRLGTTRTVPLSVPALPSLPHGDVRAVSWTVPTVLTEEVAEFFGLMVADGTVYRAGFRLAKRHLDVVERFEALCRTLFGVEPNRIAIDGTPAAEVNSTRLSAWLTDIGGMIPHDKYVPPVMLGASERLMACFLRGLFEDGTVNVRDNPQGQVIDHVRWDSARPRLVREARLLLLRQGIATSTVTTPNTEGLCLYGRNIDLFADRIGFVSGWKRDRLSLPRRPEKAGAVPLSKIEASEMRRSFKDVVGISTCQNAMNRGFLSLPDVDKILGSGRRGPLVDTLAERGSWLHERVKVVDVVSASSVCVEVPDGHRFLQNGFGGWNCQGLEYDCIVMPIVLGFRHQLQRNLIYTAVTRARQKVILIGQHEALEQAVFNSREDQRATLFVDRLCRVPVVSE